MDGLNVLIVDDEPLVSDLIRRKLAKIEPGFRIAIVNNALECLKYVAENPVDCILSDYQMPGMDGMELLDRLRASGNPIPFIFVTGQGNEEVAREAFKHGAHDYFTKEVGFAHFDRITNSIRQAAKRHRAEYSRALAEKFLAQERNKLDAIVSGIADGICIVDRDYQPVYQNTAYKEIIGDHFGKYCYEFIQGNDRVCDDCPVERTLEDGKAHNAIKLIKRGGSEKVVDVSSSPLRDHKGDIVAAVKVVRDITERSRYEQQILLLSRQNSLILESAGEGIYGIDVEGRMTFINKAALDMTGWSLDDMAGKHQHDIVHHSRTDGSEYPAEDCPIYDAFRTGRAHTVSDEVFLRKDGTSFPVDYTSTPIIEDGVVTGAVVVFRDATERLKSARRVGESERMYRAMFEDNPLPMFIHDDASFSFLAVNRAATAHYGYSEEEFLSLKAMDIRPAEDEQAYIDFVRNNPGRSGNSGIWRHRKKDGTLFYADIVSQPTEYLGHKARVVLVNDVTERMLAEKALKESEAVNRAIVGALPDMVFLLDGEGRFLDIQAADDGSLYVPRDEALLHYISDVLPEDVAGLTMMHLKAALDTGDIQVFEYLLGVASGDRDYEARVIPLGIDDKILGVVRDVTEMKRTMAEVNRSRERLLSLIDGIPDRAWMKDAEGRLLAVNRPYASACGRRPEDVVGKTDRELWPPELADYFISSDKHAISIGKPFLFEEKLVQADGAISWYETVKSPFFDDRGKVIGTTGIARDITSRKLMEEELSRVAARYGEAEAVAGLGSWEWLVGDNVVTRSEGLHRILGVQAEDFPGTYEAYISLVHPDDRERVMQVDRDAMAGKPLDYTTRIICPDGVQKTIHVHGGVSLSGDGKPYRLFGTVQDITEQNRVEEALYASQKFLETIIETEPECVKLLAPDGALIMMNRAGLDMIQAESLEQVKGKPVIELVAPEYREAFTAVGEKVFRGEDAQLEFDMVGFGGRRLRLDTHAVPLRNEKNEIIALLGVTRNVTGRVAAEQALRESEARYHTLMENANDAILLADSSTGVVVDVNRRAEELFGIGREELVGMHQSEIHPAGEAERYRRIFEEHVDRGTALISDLQILRGDGTIVPVEISSSVVELEGKKLLLGIFRDITERKAAEDELALSEQRYREAETIAKIGNWQWVVQKDLVIWSDGMFDIFGLDPNEFGKTYHSYLEFVHPDDMSFVMGQVEHTMATGELLDYETRVIRPDGEERVIHIYGRLSYTEDGKPFRLFGTIQDITDRVVADRALRASEERHRIIFEKSAVGIAVNDPGGNFYETNNTFSQMVGYSEEELLGMTVADITHPDDIEESRRQIENLNSGEQDFIDIEKRYIRKDGGVIWARTKVSRHHVTGMDKTYNIAFVQDITAKKSLENQREELFAMLRHDMKTPLAVINGSAEMIIMDNQGSLDAETLKMVEAIKSSSQSLSRMMEDLMAISRLESGPHEVDISNDDVLDLLLEVAIVAGERARSAGLQYSRELPDDLPEIPLNRLYVQRAVMNLLDNAVKYTPEGGRVTLEARLTSENGKDFVDISVSDTGPGIATEEHGLVFEKYYRSPAVNTSRSGSGLGLAIVKAVARIHGGNVELNSSEGKGSTFTLRLPVNGAK